jgi:hypothetical protein
VSAQKAVRTEKRSEGRKPLETKTSSFPHLLSALPQTRDISCLPLVCLNECRHFAPLIMIILVLTSVRREDLSAPSFNLVRCTQIPALQTRVYTARHVLGQKPGHMVRRTHSCVCLGLTRELFRNNGKCVLSPRSKDSAYCSYKSGAFHCVNAPVFCTLRVVLYNPLLRLDGAACIFKRSTCRYRFVKHAACVFCRHLYLVLPS